MPFRLGKKAARKSMFTPAFGDFLSKATSWPKVAARGWEAAVPQHNLGMLGNDRYGDCAEAGFMHLMQIQSANSGKTVFATTEQTLALYSAVTGFNPDQSASDQGTVLLDLLHYAKTNGVTMTDAVTGQDTVVKILGWASLDLTSVAQMRYAEDLFGGTYLGINCPESAQQDTTNWTYQPHSKIDGGHCVISVSEGEAGGKAVSWGMYIPYQWPFMLNYLDEGYVIVSEEWVSAKNESPSGLDLDGLLSAMKSL